MSSRPDYQSEPSLLTLPPFHNPAPVLQGYLSYSADYNYTLSSHPSTSSGPIGIFILFNSRHISILTKTNHPLSAYRTVKYMQPTDPCTTHLHSPAAVPLPQTLYPLQRPLLDGPKRGLRFSSDPLFVEFESPQIL
jgi:hypothetical protein